ncbi:MAG: EamA family transporter RarD [Bacteroidales bacterium]|nr:EamA family transporter RarD [Bacteroidales bacterium]
MPKQERSLYLSGLFYALACYSAWGVFPLYWKMLSAVPSDQILAHRIIWSVAFLLIILLATRNQTVIGYLKDKRILGLLFITGLLIGGNWFVYIYAVNHNHIVEASLGYYINPLVNVLLGVVFLGERLKKAQIIAVALAFAGVSWLTFHLGRVPWVSLYLAVSFAVYGLIRKKANLESLPGLLIETLLLSPLAIYYLWFVQQQGTGMFLNHSWLTDFLLILGGPVTAIPLFWFGKAATRIPLSTIGFIQYLSPTLQLLIGLVVYKEPFSPVYIISFGLVWAGLILYTLSIIRDYRKRVI